MAENLDDESFTYPWSVKERATAFSNFMAASMVLVCTVLPLGFILPTSLLLWVSLSAGFVKLIYLFCVFPESVKRRRDEDDEDKPLLLKGGSFNPIASAWSALALLNSNAFISRLALVLVCAALAASGYAILMPPFMMGYLGFTRSEKLILVCSAALSALIAFTCLLGPAVKVFGQVRVLQLCLAASVVVPFFVAFSQEQWQLALITFLFVGPIGLAVPLVQALKSMLVSPVEQGLIQGAVASMTKGAATAGFLLFSVVFGLTSHGGKVDSVAGVLPSFALIACLFAAAAFLASTLPTTPPPPHQEQKLLQSDSGPSGGGNDVLLFVGLDIYCDKCCCVASTLALQNRILL
ncbi:tetA [Symbiodinium pilosum]|uniref:TetA protein n=1 Tax=Symbiodinium pilosum TaxID=2952 RepID=A0A812SBY1_SYMPI|nr:tetA [Symbiodinium pilosum]